MTYLFDLDGTLVDTRLAVKEAYRQVGVEMPDGAWGKPWTEWLNNKQVHKAKAKAYPNTLKAFAQELPLYHYAHQHKCPVITGASREAVRAIQALFGGLNVIATCATHARKIEIIQTYIHDERNVAYVDDDLRVHEEIKKAGLLCSVLLPENAYRLLFPQRAPTRG
jgi:phosphoserine phosphatase